MSSPSMPSDNDGDNENVDELVSTLNDLLYNLQIPILIDTPLDLTPSLLLAILESVLESRLPISDTLRKSRDHMSKVHIMKIFLRVLEDDVMGEDVGLSDVDPSKLAQGDWDEVVFIGELLCWLGKKYGAIPLENNQPYTPGSSNNSQEAKAQKPQAHRLVDTQLHCSPSPTTHSTTTTTTRGSASTMLSMMPSAPPLSDTTLISGHANSPPLSVLDLFDTNTPPSLEEVSRMRRGAMTPPTRPTSRHTEGPLGLGPSSVTPPGRCVSEQGDSGRYAEPSSSSQARPLYGDRRTSSRTGKQSPTVRYVGLINRANEEEEIRSFEASGRNHLLPPRTPPRNTEADDLFLGIMSTSTPRRTSTSKVLPYDTPTHSASLHPHMLALLDERAKLTSELAGAKSFPRQLRGPSR